MLAGIEWRGNASLFDLLYVLTSNIAVTTVL